MEILQLEKQYNLHRLPIIRWINSFVYSKAFVVFIAICTVLSNAYALDMYFFFGIAFFAVYIAIFGKDFLPYLPMLCFCYIVSSEANNPGVNPNSILYPKNSHYVILYLAGAVIISMLLRFSLDKEVGFKNMIKQKRKLLGSIVLLGITYLISGILSEGYFSFALKNYAIAALQIAVIIVPYFILSFTVKWKTVVKDYLVFTGLMLGVSVAVELVFVYIYNGVMSHSVNLWKEYIFTGWGMSNNMGAAISTAIPFPFYYATEGKSKWAVIWLLIADFMALMVVFSCSRTSILASLFFIIVCTFIALIKGKLIIKLFALFNVLFLALLVWYFCSVYSNALSASFAGGLTSSPRIKLYTLALERIKKYPIFGGGFYALSNLAPTDFPYEWSQEINFTSFFPARWHNTILQVLVTGGAVSLLAYLYHRFKTIVLLFKKRSLETTFTFLSIFILLFESLLD
ncbi:MAG: O-antigen ligase family protein, partial [Clostridia bacterium]|nr:O-antigen ligase family protein [Clostridia bacterium]